MEPSRLKPQRDHPRYSFGATLALVTGMVVVVVGFCVIAALVGGVWADKTLGTRPVFTVALIVAAGPISLYGVYRFTTGALSRMTSALPMQEGKVKQSEEGGEDE